MIGKIAVSAAVYSIDRAYSYRIPPETAPRPGVRCLVPFGRGNKVCEGILLSLETGPEEKLKTVQAFLDQEPIVTEEMLHMAAFLRERYFCTFYEAMKAILPAGVWFQKRERYEILDADWQKAICRQEAARAVMQTIEDLGGTADSQTLSRQFEEETLEKAIAYLRRKKLLEVHTDSRRRVQDKTERIACLAVSGEEALAYAAGRRRTAPVQAAALELLAEMGRCSGKDLAYFTGATTAVLKRLEALGYLRLTQEESLRLPEQAPCAPGGPIVLNEEQEAAFQGLLAQSQEEKPGVALLYGVTGSGKTAVYLRLIEETLARGKSAVVLVPEIALTPQLLSRFTAYFGSRTAVLHSGLRITQRYDTWKKISRGEARVVLGTRSAVFAPVEDPGLFIVDEEQEHTYKSENAPRYHACEAAIYRGLQSRALVVLGSATPSIETMYRAKTGVYRLYTLKNRYNQQAMPAVTLVDMKQELRRGNGTVISDPLRLALEENRRRGEQAILLLNRRGSSPMTVCVECGFVPQCPACSVNLTYHQDNRRLMCHCCGRSLPMPPRCPRCGGPLKYMGAGTQKAQEQLEAMVPHSPVLRMDGDTISALNTHEKLLDRFRQERIPILLGTQMVAKGLDFSNVTLVGVLDGDQALYAPNYRGAETTFSMITQVIGRAGRGDKPGRAIIQTMTPENHVLCLAARQDYDSFYEEELPLRELRGCPPFRDLITLTFHGREEQGVWQAAGLFRDQLLASLSSEFYSREDVQILGPAPAQVARVNYNYRCRLTLSCRNTRSLRQLLAHLMRQFPREKRGIGLFADVNSNE